VPRDPLDPLFAAPLDEFVAARNELARRLRGEGRREEADQVKAMRKPSAVVWALNQLARTNGSGVRELLAAAETMRKVQGGRSRTSFADAQRTLAGLVRTLAREAAGLLEDGGRPASAAVVQRLDRALMATAASSETSAALQAGRLLAEPEPAGFAGLGEPGSAPPKRRPQRDAERERRQAELAAKRTSRVEAAQRELREAKAEAARLSRDAERANARVAELERALARLQAER
jgi:hypothetical protein